MDSENMYTGASEQRGDYGRDYLKLGEWLQQVLSTPERNSTEVAVVAEHDTQLHPVLNSDYHITFYQQLPDFCMALLNNEPQATVTYAPLLFHLAGCRACHRDYLDMYDALREAIYPRGPRPLLGQGTRTLSATPHRMLSHLSQTLISQAEALLRQARHEQSDNDEAARSLLQLAMRVSAHIVQSSLRRQALHDLVRVATLFDGPSAPSSSAEAGDASGTHTYVPVLATSGVRRGRADQSLHPSSADKAVIHLQSSTLEGSLVQRGNVLELHLRNLPIELRSHRLLLAVPLGKLSEQVRWHGGNPLAMRSTTLVDDAGTLVTVLGETDLNLSKPEDRNLIEAAFLQLTVRVAD